MNSTSYTLDNKVVLITGGARRIGEAIVRLLHAQGAKVIVHYKNSSDDATTLHEELNDERTGSMRLIQGDLKDISSIRNLTREAIQGMGSLDALVNNASAFSPTPISSTTEDQWQSIMDINLKAPFFLSQAVAPYLKKTKGCIVNITDIYADRPLVDHPVYSASKAGLVSLTKSLARDLGPEIRVNAVAPGAILWPENQGDEVSHQRLISSTPLKRKGSPDDIARSLLFLIADANFITGQVINVDGGRTVFS
jgi:pteridine reductase